MGGEVDSDDMTGRVMWRLRCRGMMLEDIAVIWGRSAFVVQMMVQRHLERLRIRAHFVQDDSPRHH